MTVLCFKSLTLSFVGNHYLGRYLQIKTIVYSITTIPTILLQMYFSVVGTYRFRTKTSNV